MSKMHDLMHECLKTGKALCLSPVQIEEFYSDFEQELAATKQKLEAAEQAIRESQEKEPVAHVLNPDAQTVWWSDKFKHISEVPEKDTALYAKPVIIPQSAEQLHIKELWGALDIADGYMPTYGRDSICNDHIYVVKKALAKQPNTRALDKALLEAELKGLNNIEWEDRNPRLNEIEAKLAELNKE